MRLCTTCGQDKPIDAFPKDPTHRRCKQCKSAGSKASYQRHKAAAIARAGRWRSKNIVKAKAQRRAWQKKNMPRIGPVRAAQARRRYHADIENQRAYFREKERQKRITDPMYVKRRYADNREKFQTAAREWARRHPEARKRKYYANIERSRKRGREDSRRRRARKMGATIGRIKYDRIIVRDKMRCHICKLKIKTGRMHFDHVIPLAVGGSHTEDNIAVSHARCNLTKGAKRLTLF